MPKTVIRLKRSWWQKFSQKHNQAISRLQTFWKLVEGAWPSATVLVVLAVILLLLRQSYFSLGEINRGIYIEAWGTFFDIFIVGIVLTLFTFVRDRKERINRYLEEIDDFKKWDNEEGRLRIAGNLRRLGKLGKTDIDLSGIVLRNFSFLHQDIESLKGATFSMGLRLDRFSKNATKLENVDFASVDCRGVIFSKNLGEFAGLGLNGKNLQFTDAKLCGACFDGAELSWTNFKSNTDDWYVDMGEDDDGRPMRHQKYYPAFSGADLEKCSFRYAELDHADFRNAVNILSADFTGASGLKSCFFDEDVKGKIITAAIRTSESE